MTGKQIAATIGISGLSIFAGIGIALLFLQPRAISQTASKDEHSSSKKITREEAEAEIDSVLRQGDEGDAGNSFRRSMRESFQKIWRSEIKTLDDFRLSPSAAEALAEYEKYMRKYNASREDEAFARMDKQKKRDGKKARHVVEKTFPLAAMGCQKALAYLFENGISDVNYGYLHCAAAAGRTDMIDFLLKCGADINLPDKDRQTPLGYVKNRDPKIEYLTAWYLVDRGADLFGDPHHGLRPDGLLYLSAKYGDLDRVKKLVEEFHVKPKDAEFFSKILKDASSSEIKAYLEREADRRNWKYSAWDHKEASKDEHSSSKKITREEAEAEIDSALRQGGEGDAGNSFRRSMRESFQKIWRSEIKTLDDFRLSPSAAEALAEYGTFMRKYHASGKDESLPRMDKQKKRDGKKAMHVVEKTFPLAAMGCQKALIYLFENGISDVNYIGDGGYLHYAAAAGRTDMIDFLLRYGANINFPDKDRQTPLGWTDCNGNPKTGYLTAWYLVDRGADIFGNKLGLRPDGLLYLSAKFGDLNRMKKLVEEFHVKPEDAEFFSKILKDTASSEIKAYLEREADRRNWEEAWREEARKKKEREREEKRREKAPPDDAAAEGKAQPAALKSESAEAKLLAEPPQKAPVKITHGRVMTQEKPEKPATPREDPAEVQRRIKQYQLAMQQQFEFDRLQLQQLQRTHELNAQMNQAIMNMGQSMIDPMPIMPAPMPMPRPSRPTGYCSIHKQSYSLPGSCPQCSAPNFGFPTPLDGLLH